MVRLGDRPFERPPITFQDKLTDEQIHEMLNDYTSVKDLTAVPLQTHLRYFKYEERNGEKKRSFRVGGKLIKKDADGRYVVLSNGQHSWSVTVDSATFFRPLTVGEVKQRYEKKIDALKKTINTLQGGGAAKTTKKSA